MSTRRVVAGALLAGVLGAGVVACSSSSNDDSGAVTNLDDVGPEVAKLRAEVNALHEEVRALREQLATAGITTTTTTTPLR